MIPFDNAVDIFSTPECILSKAFDTFSELRTHTENSDNASPIEPVSSKKLPLIVPIGLLTGSMTFNNDTNPSPRSFAISNNPLNVFLRFSLFLLPRINVSVKE